MNSSDLSNLYFTLFTNFLTTPAGVAAVFMMILMAGCSMALPNTRWVLIGGALYAATLPINQVNMYEEIYVPLAFPLEQIRLYARPITLMFLVIMLLPLITSERGWRQRILPVPLLLFFLFQIGIALRLIAFGGTDRGTLSIVSYTLVALSFGLAAGQWLQGLNDVYKLLWAINGAVITLLVATCYQLAINRAPIMAGSRLSGATGNPQFLSVILALTIPTACFLLLHSRNTLRPWLLAQVAVSILMLLWTGSRTGFLGGVVGIVVLFHRRIGRFLIVGLLVVAGIYLVLPLFEGSVDTASRLLSTENTRAQNWGIMMNDIQSHFWFGVSNGLLSVSESSYLAMMSQVGLFGSLPFVAAWLGAAYLALRMQVIRGQLGDQQMLVDLVCGFFATIAVTAMGEGYLLGVLVFPVLLIFLFGALTAYLFDHARAVNEQPLEIDGFGEVWPAAA